MIIGAHSIIYAEDAERTRAFFRDVLGFPYVDVHEGWLIFKLPPGELGIHPVEPSGSGRHELYLLCDDLDRTIEELKARGVEFSGEITNAGFGRVISLNLPGAGEVALYQPRHALAISLPD
jgi:catechol 2,3-dioxygenase-like lactoylglutathione lyase family enzyme